MILFLLSQSSSCLTEFFILSCSGQSLLTCAVIVVVIVLQARSQLIVVCFVRVYILFHICMPQGHNAAISCVTVLMDSRRIISADRDSLLCVWLGESGTLLQTIQGPYKNLAATNNMKFAVILTLSFFLCFGFL